MNVSRLSVFRKEGSITANSLNREFNNLVYSMNKISNGVSPISSSNTYIDLIPQAVAPTLKQGRLYFNSVDQQLYICKDGATWSIAA